MAASPSASSSASWAAAAAAAAAAVGSDGPVEVTPQALMAFYFEYNPTRAKEDKIVEVLERYKGRHEALLVNLHHMYNAVPATQPASRAETATPADASAGSRGAAASGAPTTAVAAATPTPSSSAAAGRSAASAWAVGAAGTAVSGAGGGSCGGGSTGSGAPLLLAAAQTGTTSPAAATTSSTQLPHGIVAEPAFAEPRPAPQPGSQGLAPGPGTGHAKVQGQGARSSAERLRRLEREAREEAEALAVAQAQLAAVRPQVADLEARWGEVSTISEDARRQADETHEQLRLLRRAAEQKDAQIAAVEGLRESAAAEMQRAAREHEALAAGFDDRLQLELQQKERDLQREAAALRRAAEESERQVKDLAAQKARLEQLQVHRGAGPERGEVIRESMFEAHNTIAKAFSDASKDYPCVRVVDEPLLKLTAALFRHAVFRRLFFITSAMVWVFALHHAISASA